jgi:glycolate oxidase iron-sulfur subunit
LIDAGRTLQHGDDRPAKRRFRRAVLNLFVKPGPMHLAAGLLRFYQRSGLQTVLRSTQLLNRIGLGAYDRLLPPLAKPFRAQGIVDARARASQKVALFIGCVSRHLEAPVLDSAVAVLSRLGCAVVIPPGQGCCGALHQHGGEPQAARRLAERNLEAFAACGADSIVGVDTGCSAHLVEYPALIEGSRQAAAARAFSKQTLDISHYLTGLAWPEALALRPLHARVAVHEPCSLRNVLKQEQAPYALLRKIPGLEIMSKRLLEDKINAVRSLNPDILATSNVGCALQLAAGVRAAGLRIEVLHPVQLIARQMEP